MIKPGLLTGFIVRILLLHSIFFLINAGISSSSSSDSAMLLVFIFVFRSAVIGLPALTVRGCGGLKSAEFIGYELGAVA